MYFKQFYLGCLAHASYLVADGGEAAVVDPQRDVEIYLDEARSQGLTIRHVIETHLHADFVSGHRELADCAGQVSARAHLRDRVVQRRPGGGARGQQRAQGGGLLGSRDRSRRR